MTERLKLLLYFCFSAHLLMTTSLISQVTSLAYDDDDFSDVDDYDSILFPIGKRFVKGGVGSGSNRHRPTGLERYWLVGKRSEHPACRRCLHHQDSFNCNVCYRGRGHTSVPYFSKSWSKRSLADILNNVPTPPQLSSSQPSSFSYDDDDVNRIPATSNFYDNEDVDYIGDNLDNDINRSRLREDEEDDEEVIDDVKRSVSSFADNRCCRVLGWRQCCRRNEWTSKVKRGGGGDGGGWAFVEGRGRGGHRRTRPGTKRSYYSDEVGVTSFMPLERSPARGEACSCCDRRGGLYDLTCCALTCAERKK